MTYVWAKVKVGVVLLKRLNSKLRFTLSITFNNIILVLSSDQIGSDQLFRLYTNPITFDKLDIDQSSLIPITTILSSSFRTDTTNPNVHNYSYIPTKHYF